MKSFGDLLNERANNFDFLRFFMASLVILQHSFALLYGMPALRLEPLARLTNGQIYSGGLAVYSFFVISGFLITKSWESSRGAMDYVRKRVLRIYPGYVVAILASVLIVAPLGGSTLHDYLADRGVLKYLAVDLTFLGHCRDTLPGAFKDSPVPFHTNGSLWTIRLEAICYAMVAALGFFGILASRGRRQVRLAVSCGLLVVLLLALQVAYFHFKDRGVVLPLLGPAEEFPYLAPYFVAGMLFYLLRDRLPSSPLIAAGVFAAIAISVALNVSAATLPLLLPYVLLYLAFEPRLRVQDFGKRGDVSYGMYLYGWPVQQVLVQYFGRWLNPWTLCALAWIVTLCVAALSWHFVEKPFLSLKKHRALRDTAIDAPAHAVVAEPVRENEALSG